MRPSIFLCSFRCQMFLLSAAVFCVYSLLFPGVVRAVVHVYVVVWDTSNKNTVSRMHQHKQRTVAGEREREREMCKTRCTDEMSGEIESGKGVVLREREKEKQHFHRQNRQQPSSEHMSHAACLHVSKMDRESSEHSAVYHDRRVIASARSSSKLGSICSTLTRHNSSLSCVYVSGAAAGGARSSGLIVIACHRHATKSGMHFLSFFSLASLHEEHTLYVYVCVCT